MTGAVFSMDGRGLDLLRGGGLIAMGIITYADIFGDLHLVEFCHRAQFGPIDWEGVPAADWRARATAVASRRPESSDMRREAGIVAGAAAQR